MELKELKKFVNRKYICVNEIVLNVVIYSKEIIKKDDVVKVMDWVIFDKGENQQIGDFGFVVKRLKDNKIFKILADDIKYFEVIK